MAQCGFGLVALLLAPLELSQVALASFAQLNTTANVTAAASYDQSMARAMATLSKLTNCGLGPKEAVPFGTSGAMRSTAHKSCGKLCEAAGFKLGTTVLVSASDRGQEHADFAFVSALEPLGTRPLPADCAVAIRGTWVSPSNFRRDGETELVDWPMPSCRGKGCKVHQGADAIWREIEDQVVGALKELQCRSTVVTGHSLGGQLAVLAMFSLQDRHNFRVGLSYTFAAPQPFNEAARSVFDGGLFDRPISFFRITHTNDNIPLMPQDPGYAQPGSQVWFYGSASAEEYVHCGTSAQAPRCGVDSLPLEVLCSMFEKTNWKHCGGNVPVGGPHCGHPLAPAGSFCNMAGHNRAGFVAAATNTCLLGHRLRQMPLQPTLPPAVFPVPSPWPVRRNNVSAEGGCFVADFAYTPLDMLGHLVTSQQSIQACQKHCQSIEECEYITFWNGTGTCHVTGAWGKRLPTKGATSGPRDCAVTLPEETDVSRKIKMEQEYLDSLSGQASKGFGWGLSFPGLYTEHRHRILPTERPTTMAALGFSTLILVVGAAAVMLAARFRRNTLGAPLFVELE